MKQAILYTLPSLLWVLFYPARVIGWKENDWLGPTFQDVSLDPYAEETGACDKENFLTCYEAIMEYIEKGVSTIRISNATDAVMVIGLTRVGKSTATQFVANHSNPLAVECKYTECYLLDDSGDGGNDVISKTFVPNTIENIDTNGVITPFYDMPGFDDSRGVAVEIANSFFIQRVIKGIKRIKIIVVAKHASFTPTETSFKLLMGNLIKFTRTPEKFKDSIVLIASMGYYDLPDEKHFEGYRHYLDKYNQSMDTYDSPHLEEDIPVVRKWIKSFVETATDNPTELTNAALFRTPPFSLEGKSIRDDPVFEKDYQRMKNIIWDRTAFTPVTSDDIGFTMSIEADKFLDDAAIEAGKVIKKEVLNFTTAVSEHLKTQLQRITESISEDEMAKFLANYNLMKMVDFKVCNSLPESSPQVCVDDIRTQLSTLVEEMSSDVFDGIHTISEFLQFIYADVRKPKEYDMTEWVTGFKQIPPELEKDIKAKVDQTSNTVRVHLTNFSNQIRVYLDKLVESASESASEAEMNKFLALFNVMKALEFVSCRSHPDSTPDDCINQFSGQLSGIADEMANPVFQEISPMVKFLQFAFADIKLNKSYDMTEWTNSFREISNLVEQKTDQIASLVSGQISAYFKGNFSMNTRLYFQGELHGLQTEPIPGDEHFTLLNATIIELLNAEPENFQHCIKLGSPNDCYQEILDKMKFIITASRSDVREKLVKPISFLEFLHKYVNITEIDVRDWVSGFINLRNTVGDENEKVVKVIFNNRALEVEYLASGISKSILSQIPNFTAIEEVTNYLQVTELLLYTIDDKLVAYGDQRSLAGYMELLIKEYSKIKVEHPDASKLRLNVIRMIESIKNFSWYTASWSNFHKVNLAKPVSVEYSVCKFLLDLFSDLEGHSVQSMNVLHQWRKSNTEVTDFNFDDFWTTFHVSNIKTMTTHKTNQGVIKEHIGFHNYSRVWLNQALDYSLLWKSACPSSTSSVTVFKGRYMSLRFVKMCLEQQSKISKHIVVLSDEVFFFDSEINLSEQLDSKVQMFVMSRHFDTTKQGIINIHGQYGDPPPNKPGGTAGTPGKVGAKGVDGGDLIGVYLNTNGGNVIVDACGGDGGKGQDGGDGKDSDSTIRPSIGNDGDGRIPDSQCTARSGSVKVHIYPNSCNTKSDDDVCATPDTGRWVAVWGPAPQAGTLGGRGGSGGKGGLGGLSAMLGVYASLPRVEMFSNGTLGENGRNGVDGRKGIIIPICIRVDDKHCGSCGRKRCYRVENGEMSNQCKNLSPKGVANFSKAIVNTTEIVSLRHFRQSPRARCTSSTGSTYDIYRDFKEYMKTFYNSANQNLNIFNRNKMSEFLNYVRNHELLLNGEML